MMRSNNSGFNPFPTPLKQNLDPTICGPTKITHLLIPILQGQQTPDSEQFSASALSPLLEISKLSHDCLQKLISITETNTYTINQLSTELYKTNRAISQLNAKVKSIEKGISDITNQLNTIMVILSRKQS